ncbi:hypothetical protein [Streptomyces sp. NPDC058855]
MQSSTTGQAVRLPGAGARPARRPAGAGRCTVRRGASEPRDRA